LVGSFDSGVLRNSYSTGAVSGTVGIGGLVGEFGLDPINSFWDIETSGLGASLGSAGTGKTTTEMKGIATFDGWDIATSSVLNGQYPSFASSGTAWHMGLTAVAPTATPTQPTPAADSDPAPTAATETARESAQQLASKPIAGPSMTAQVLPSGSVLNLASNSGGLSFLAVSTEVVSGTDASTGSAAGTEVTGGSGSSGSRSAGSNETQGGSDPLGFMRVFVVNGGINLPVTPSMPVNTPNTVKPSNPELSGAAVPGSPEAPERLSRNTADLPGTNL
jgi:hypothetical protein